MSTWFDYRSVWSAHPWVAFVGFVAIAVIVAAVVATVLGNVIAVLFIPGLAALYLHHLVVQKYLDE